MQALWLLNIVWVWFPTGKEGTKEGEDKEDAKKWGGTRVYSGIIYKRHTLEAAQVPADGGIVKLWCVHRMEYYSALKSLEILKHVITWMNLEDMML